MHMIYKVKFVGRLMARQGIAWLMMVFAWLGFSPAAADVIEVGANGTATVYSGPTLFLGTTISPVLKPEPKVPAAAAASREGGRPSSTTHWPDADAVAQVAPDLCSAARADASVTACTSPNAKGTSATIISSVNPSSGASP
jgi:hypothetical protein